MLLARKASGRQKLSASHLQATQSLSSHLPPCVRLCISREDSAATRLVPSSGRYDRASGGGFQISKLAGYGLKLADLCRWSAMSTVWIPPAHIMATQTCSSSVSMCTSTRHLEVGWLKRKRPEIRYLLGNRSLGSPSSGYCCLQAVTSQEPS